MERSASRSSEESLRRLAADNSHGDVDMSITLHQAIIKRTDITLPLFQVDLVDSLRADGIGEVQVNRDCDMFEL